MLEIAIIDITKGEEVIQYSKEWMRELSVADGNKLYEAVNALKV